MGDVVAAHGDGPTHRESERSAKNSKESLGASERSRVAVVAIAARLGWDFINAHTVITDLGATINLRVDPPKVVADLVYEAVKRCRWKRIEKKHPYLATSVTGRGANMAPIWKLL